jgi:uncharacterized SAM-binding protein YcdF (DUF218 family)
VAKKNVKAPEATASKSWRDRFTGPRLWRYGAGLFVLAACFLTAGFQHYVLTLPRASGAALAPTDGIVVTTGGQQRLSDGLELLSLGKAEKLLISGVGEGVNRAILVQELNLDAGQINALFCCTELEYGARDTRGNALATREWAEKHQMRSLRLVTANYHMPRALVVFSQEMPTLDIYQWPVSPPDLDHQNWWQDPQTRRLLMREYAKYLGARIGL